VASTGNLYITLPDAVELFGGLERIFEKRGLAISLSAVSFPPMLPISFALTTRGDRGRRDRDTALRPDRLQ
jgi:hypothetical protein